MIPQMLRLLAFSPLLTLLCFAGCTPSQPATLSVTNAWIRPIDASLGIAGALYLTINNQTTAPVVLTGSTAPVADTVELHLSTMSDNIMRMRPVQSLSIDAGEQLTFAPGGHHLMLKGLASSLVAGDSLSFTLQFEAHPPLTGRAMIQWETR